MKRFEHTRFFQLLSPFLNPLLHRLLFLDERFVLFATQILLSGLLYLMATSLHALLLTAIPKMGFQPDITEVLKAFVQVGILVVIFWNM